MVAVVAGAYGEKTGLDSTARVDALDATATSMKRYTERTIVIGDTPEQPQQPIDCLLSRGATLLTCTSVGGPQRFFPSDLLSKRLRGHAVPFLDTRRWFCFENACPMVIGHTIAYWEGTHITRTYALQLLRPFRALFRGALAQGRPPLSAG